ncbi:MAG TPA: histidine kinase dimerization/phospho-acceptor domain-containing protein [Candidatus Dormibacteraeota bacterium]|nr:histidine kinase dimerization/phospho-acceptor domain-containing protein [Candidatus Dormibacteraeota bacterium]
MTSTKEGRQAEAELLQRLLSITHDILAAQEIGPALEQIARAVSELFGFTYVTIVAADAPGEDLFRRVLHGFPEEIVRTRLGERIVREDILGFLEPQSQVLPNCYYTPAEHETFWARSIYTGYRPLDELRSAPGAWHERDTLALVLPDHDGQMLGYLSADAPTDGKVPSRETLRKMQLFVNLVGLALANTRAHQAEIERRRILEENARVQNEFFSMISHEVRSPLAAIRGASALFETHFESRGAERRQEACFQAPRCGSRPFSRTSCCFRGWRRGISPCGSSRSIRSRFSRNRWRGFVASTRSALFMRPIWSPSRRCWRTLGEPCRFSPTCSKTP